MGRELLVEKTSSFRDMSNVLTQRYKSLRLVMFLPNYQTETTLDYNSYTMLLSAFEFDFKSEFDVTLEIFEYLLENIDQETYDSIERINIISSFDFGLINLLRAFHIEDSFVEVGNTRVNNFILPDGIITHAKMNPLEKPFEDID